MSKLAETLKKILKESSDPNHIATGISEPYKNPEEEEIETGKQDAVVPGKKHEMEEDYTMNPTTVEMEDPSGDETGDKDADDIRKNGMGKYIAPVAGMGTYMREEVNKVITEASKFKIDRAAMKPLFESEGNLSEDFINKAADIFEAACADKITQIGNAILESAATAAISLYEKEVNRIEKTLDVFTEEVAKQWLVENKLAVESGIRTELAESFIESLKNVFNEHYIEVPQDKVDILESLQVRAETLEEQTSAEIEKNSMLKWQLNEAEKAIAFMKATRGMTEMQIAKLTPLCESIKFDNENDFIAQVKTLSESVVTQQKPKGVIMEDFGGVVVDNTPQQAAVQPMSIVDLAVRAATENATKI